MLSSARAKALVGPLSVAVLLFALGAGCGSSTTAGAKSSVDARVAHAYSTAFDFSSSSSADKVAVIDNGSSIEEAIKYVQSSSLAGSATGTSTEDTRLLSDSECVGLSLPTPCAAVTYVLLGPDHRPLFSAHSQGHAVNVDGRWLVAQSTACDVLKIFYSALGTSTGPPGC